MFGIMQANFSFLCLGHKRYHIFSLEFGVTHTISKSQFSSFALATSSNILSLEIKKNDIKIYTHPFDVGDSFQIRVPNKL